MLPTLYAIMYDHNLTEIKNQISLTFPRILNKQKQTEKKWKQQKNTTQDHVNYSKNEK